MAIDAGWACGKEVDDDVRLDAAGMRQAIAWELALRNVKRLEAAEAEALLRRETQCEAVRDVKVRPAAAPEEGKLCAIPQPSGRVSRCAKQAAQNRLCQWLVIALRQSFAATRSVPQRLGCGLHRPLCLWGWSARRWVWLNFASAC